MDKTLVAGKISGWYMGRMAEHHLNKVDRAEAPAGYYAYPKSACSHERGNLCRQCDWREDCTASVMSCMSYGRKDGVSVVFKRVNPEGSERA